MISFGANKLELGGSLSIFFAIISRGRYYFGIDLSLMSEHKMKKKNSSVNDYNVVARGG